MPRTPRCMRPICRRPACSIRKSTPTNATAPGSFGRWDMGTPTAGGKSLSLLCECTVTTTCFPSSTRTRFYRRRKVSAKPPRSSTKSPSKRSRARHGGFRTPPLRGRHIAKLPRRHTQVLLEESAEVALIGEAARARDLRHGKLRVGKKFGSMLDAALADIFSDGHAKVFVKLARKMHGMNSGNARQGGQAGRFEIRIPQQAVHSS